MDQFNNFKYFSLNSDIREFVSNKEGSGNQRSCFIKYRRRICVAVLVLAMTLIIFSLLKSTTVSTIQKKEKTKRSVNINGYPDIIITSKTNIEIIPQNRQINQHQNHKYIEKEPQNNSHTLINKINARKGWSFESFQSKTDKRLSQFQDKIIKSEFNIQKPKEQEKLINELLTDSESSMRLKGVYVQPENKNIIPKNGLDGKYYNSKEINNLMLNDFGNDGRNEKENLFMENGFRSHGAPFQVSPIGQENRNRKKITNRLNQFYKRQPITLYLEIYPMNDFQGLKRRYKQENKFHNSESSYIFNLEKISPRVRRNRMIMKLNLYPKESNFPERYFRVDPGTKYNKRAERKSVGLFFKHKKKKNKPKECSLMGIHPRGKGIGVKC